VRRAVSWVVVRNDAERELVREATRRVLARHGLMTITRDWNREACRATDRPRIGFALLSLIPRIDVPATG
jgi:hypothetical protein